MIKPYRQPGVPRTDGMTERGQQQLFEHRSEW
jgi:hypothetical protein